MIAKRARRRLRAGARRSFLADAERLLAGLDGPVDRETILALEPVPHAMLDEAACEEAYLAIADMIDMRMPFTFGHSRAVAALADAAGQAHGPARPPTSATLRWAAYTHDIGELAVPVSTWMRAGAADRARDRRRAAASLPRRARAGGARRRRQGWSRRWCCAITSGSTAAATTATPAAPTFRRPRASLPRPKPSRPRARRGRTGRASSDAAAAAKLRGAVAGRASSAPTRVEAVLACAGQPARRDGAERLAGLTPREIEVLRLIAAGHTAKEAARQLEIAPKTADNHIQSLYSKIGVTTRAGAALYALERGLVETARAA